MRMVPALVMVIGAAAAAEEPRRFEFTQLAMGDRVRIVLFTEDEGAAREAAAAAFVRIEELERVMSDYRADSELMRLCARAGEDAAVGGIRVSEDLFEVLARAIEVAEATGGAFDPTMGSVVRLWRESRRGLRLPAEGTLREALRRTGHGKLVVSEGTRTVALAQSGMQLDLGGIGKGYAADAVAAVLEGAGVRSYLVAVGGDVVAGHAPPREEGWTVAIGPGEKVLVLLERGAISTSGDTEQYLEIDGVRYSHIVDPRTGIGVTSRSLVTVAAPSGATADAVATAVSVLGADGLGAARGLGAEVRIDWPDGTAQLTSGFPRAGGAAYVGWGTARINTPPAGFEALFNGRDLEGWTGVAADPPVLAAMTDEQRARAAAEAEAGARAHWSVVDGTLAFDGAGGSLRTTEEFGDFELLLDWKIAPEGDSGVYLRGCPQVQIWDNPAGSGGLYNNEKAGSRPRHVADRPAGEWNTFRIVLVGDEVTVYLNGRLVVDRAVLENYWDRGRPVPERGPIWLQAHGTPLWFRNVYIRRLDGEIGPPR